MKQFDERFMASLRSQNNLLNQVVAYMMQRRGKGLRPLLVLLTAKVFGPVTEQAYRSAVLIETFHTASLLHDDVVDKSDIRHGSLTVNTKWSADIAVLLGDFMLSKALDDALANRDYALLREASEVVTEMSEGEMLQKEKAILLDITEEEYFRIIRQKTAALLALCAKAGAESAGCPPETCARLQQFGYHLGMAFQIKDDLFDLALKPGEAETGKPRGNDLRERKITLPFIHALREAPSGERKAMLRLLEKGPQLTEEDVATVSAWVVRYGGIAYAEQKMQEFHQEADRILQKFADRPHISGLKRLLDFVVQRAY